VASAGYFSETRLSGRRQLIGAERQTVSPSLGDGTAQAGAPEAVVIETDVLVIGSGPAGASAALMLSTLGIPNIMITKYRWTANTPRAHLINQRALEVFRDMGIEEQIHHDAAGHELVGDSVVCTSLAGEEIGRIHTWGTHPDREADYQRASPCLSVDLPQTYLEPILVRNATLRGTHTRFSTEYLSLRQDEDGVDVVVLDRLTNHQYTIRAEYVIGADGARSEVAEHIGLPFEGQMDVHGSMSIMFKADLAHLCAHRPSALYFVIQPGSNVGGVGAGVVRMVRPWNEWLINWGYDITEGAPVVDDAEAARIARNLIGEPDIDVEILGVSLWGINEMWATHLQSGRVFCIGDAIHRHPPGNALGANTSVQDSYNLVWKIAAVLRWGAASSLLESYSMERAAIAQRIVKRANQSPRDWGRFYEALGLTEAVDVADMARQLDVRKDNSEEGRRRRAALVEAMDFKNYEFNTHGHDMGQFYESEAIVSDGSVLPEPGRDPELYYEQSTVPGSHLPHAWVGDQVDKLATMDIAPYTQFTLITGIAGEDWVDAAEKVSAELGVPLAAVVIGPGRPITDLYYDWAKVREVEESGALLIRPDKHVAWRATTLPDDPQGALRSALAQVLGRAAIE
jgi:2,4-dichlorophenol 6-monooxygenase